MSARLIRDASDGGGDTTLDDSNKIACIHGIPQCLFSSVAGSSHDGFMIVKRNIVQDESVDIRLDCSQDGLGATSTFSVVQPDNVGPFIAGESFGDFRGESRTHAHHCGHGSAELHEIATINAAFFQPFHGSFLAMTYGKFHRTPP